MSPTARPSVTGTVVDVDGEAFYRIAHYDHLRPFFLTLVSATDHWLFLSSTGGLTAGRRDANLALFPYYTDDKIRDGAEVTGSKTILRVRTAKQEVLWEPFSIRSENQFRLERQLYKNLPGTRIMFEEHHAELRLTFRYSWTTSAEFGFIRQAWLSNASSRVQTVKLLDGVQNLMPCGPSSQFNLEYSTLLDAYKRSELLPATGLGIFRLSAIPVDRPEPAEALRANVAWQLGLTPATTLLSSLQLDNFRRGLPLRSETDVRAERGAYFSVQSMRLAPRATITWLLGADVNQSAASLVRLQKLLRAPETMARAVVAEGARTTRELRRIVATADGLQSTAQPLVAARHFSNTLFNVMRGGVFVRGYEIPVADLRDFVQTANRPLAPRHRKFFRHLGAQTTYQQLVIAAAATGDAQLERLCQEYLPLTFSRRHGDPSRPWNKFTIATRNADGTPRLNYEGNWRDIFQNWEALAVSFPEYLPGMICRFLNASTADGYNPYRLTRNGIEWEIADPHDPWSHIGYWGDHQIIYLLKLLEQWQRHDPAALPAWLSRRIFAYANVPYRIKPFAAVRRNPKDTVAFCSATQQAIDARVAGLGADGKLRLNARGEVQLVTLLEKLLVPVLTKLSNFIPDAGIWLNTQRPEWNDANNALVGNGVSMVTLYYLRRHLQFCRELLERASDAAFPVSADVAGFLRATGRILRHAPGGTAAHPDRRRAQIATALGQAGGRYREKLYAHGLAETQIAVARDELLRFFQIALDWVTPTITRNRRPDGLYHAYNLVRFEARERWPIRRLYEMLEGQVAVLSSGQLSPPEALEVITALRRSRLYRAAERSYLLYPDRALPTFLARNNLPPAALKQAPLLRALLADHNHALVERDAAGGVHFQAHITNAREVDRILSELARSGYAARVRRDRRTVLAWYERLFDHESFTGRSGTFFGYEGLGCIYWHMVSKLLLAVQENFFSAQRGGATPRLLRALAAAYYDIRAGLGAAKSPAQYGAFPMDPYSHTPGAGGARQPGLTGQVKEDYLCRFGELGVVVAEGEIRFRPWLLPRGEFLSAPGVYEYWDVHDQPQCLKLQPGELAFTYCQIPIIYRRAAQSGGWIVRGASREVLPASLCLERPVARECFARSGQVTRIEVELAEDWFALQPVSR